MTGWSAQRLAPLAFLSPQGRRARLLIFTYHRVLPRPDPLLPDEPDAELFARQMDWLARYCRVLPLSEAVQRLLKGTLPDRAACITFDDGYANNHDIAMPILLQRGLPATVFVTVDAIERGVMWNDLVIEAVRNGAAASGAADGNSRAVVQSAPNEVAAMLDKLKYRPPAARWEAATRLYEDTAGAKPPRLMMTQDMVRSMARAGFEIGAHTVHHPILKQQSLEDSRREIYDSRDWLRGLLGENPKSFAYPNGRPGRDYEDVHAQMVRQAGFDSAVSTHWNCARATSDPFQLPRVSFWDRTEGKFWLRLARTYAQSYFS